MSKYKDNCITGSKTIINEEIDRDGRVTSRTITTYAVSIPKKMYTENQLTYDGLFAKLMGPGVAIEY